MSDEVIRARVVVVNDETGSGIGIEVYKPVVRRNIVRFIGSLYVDRIVSRAEGLRIAVEKIREVYGDERPVYVKTKHRNGQNKFIPMEGVKVRLETRHNYTDTTNLAEDALKSFRRFDILEKL